MGFVGSAGKSLFWSNGGIFPYSRQHGTPKNAAAATREPSAALADTAELPASQKCQFGG